MPILYFFLGVLFIYMTNWLQMITDVFQLKVSLYQAKVQKQANDMLGEQEVPELTPAFGFHYNGNSEEYYEDDEEFQD